MAESSQMAADRALALLMLDSHRLTLTVEGQGQNLLNEVRIFEPSLEAETKRFLNRVLNLSEGVQALGKKRSLHLRGEVGEAVEYSPNEHQGIDGSIVGSRRVRIVRPLVERILGNQIPTIILKASVEPD